MDIATILSSDSKLKLDDLRIADSATIFEKICGCLREFDLELQNLVYFMSGN